MTTPTSDSAAPPAMMFTLAVGTLAPALVIAAIRGLWPQLWVQIAISIAAVAGVAASAWYLRRRVPHRVGHAAMRIEKVHAPNAVPGFLGLYVTPCAVALASQPPTRWVAALALVFIGIVAARSNAVLSANPLLVLIGVHTHHVQVRQVGQDEGPAMNVIMLSRNRTPVDTGSLLENLIPVGCGVYMHAERPATTQELQ